MWNLIVLGNPSPNIKAQQEIIQFMKKNYRPGFTYQDFAVDFSAEFFNATEWADLIEKSGAKYVLWIRYYFNYLFAIFTNVLFSDMLFLPVNIMMVFHYGLQSFLIAGIL